VPDDDDVLTPTGDSGSDVLKACSRRESVVWLVLGAEGPRQLVAGLARTQERARKHNFG